jgi:hypothetical protein
VAKQLPPVHQNRLRQAGRSFGAALALFALCLRLVWPAPPVPAAADTSLVAALGEHALCLAAPLADGKAAPASERQAPHQGDHADHDGLGCCLWHAVAGFTLPPVGGAARVAFAEIRAPGTIPSTSLLPARSAGPAQARAPPLRS